MALSIGADVGTYNLVVARRRGGADDEKKNDVVHKREINAFLSIPLSDDYVFNMLKESKVPLIERKDVAYALGEAAVKMAYAMPQIDLRRPMSDGCLNPKEKDSMDIMKVMTHSLIGDIKQNAVLYYSVPANAINDETDADYHSQILEAIFKSYKSSDGYTVDPHPINEGLALVFAELANKQYTGIGASFGAGMVNVCFSVFSQPVFQFSVVNSGDWIDKMAAKATGENITYINQVKKDVDLVKPPENMVERAIQTQYKLMIMNTIKNIKKGLSEANKKARTGEPIDFIISGGTASLAGFDTMFTEIIKDADLPIDIGKIIRPKDPLYSVARGCLIAAENSQK